MAPIVDCGCELCIVEARLESELAALDKTVMASLFAPYPTLLPYSSPSVLLSRLRHLTGDTESDHLLRDLIALRPNEPALVESFLVLAFLPLLHRSVRRVARQQSLLSSEDIAQEALRFFVEFACSDHIRRRKSHFAFVIAREVKRHIFRWAGRESRGAALLEELEETASSLCGPAPFEPRVELQHFLDRCVASGVVTESEVDLLVDCKLNGGANGRFDDSSSNAVRQRVKRSLEKLRRHAQ